MPPAQVTAIALLVAVAGCLDGDPPPDIDRMTIRVLWVYGNRTLEVTVPEIPCTGTKQTLLGEDGVQCNSAPWTLTVDGVAFKTTPVMCTSAYHGLFGSVDKHCTGGRASGALPEAAGEDLEIDVSTDGKRVRKVLTGVRRIYTWTEEAPFQGPSQPALVRLEPGLEASGEFDMPFVLADGTPARGEARSSSDDAGQLALAIRFAIADGVYTARVEAYVERDAVTVAVPIEGTFTVANAPR